MAANPQTKTTNLGCRLLPSAVTPIVAIYCHYLAQRLIPIYHPTKSRKPSRPRWLATYRDGLPTHGQSPIQHRVTTLIKNNTLLLSHVTSERDYF